MTRVGGKDTRRVRSAALASATCAALALTGCSTSADGTAVPADPASSSTEMPSPGEQGGRTTISDLPTPITVTVPAQWRAARPAAAGAPQAAFVAFYMPTAHASFAVNISVFGQLVDESVSLRQLADQQVQVFRQQGADPTVRSRKKGGSEDAPSHVQSVRYTQNVNGRPMKLAQIQALIGMRDQRGSGQMSVVLAQLTATPQQIKAATPGFQTFVRSIRPQNG